jgi:hypothetical protein
MRIEGVATIPDLPLDKNKELKSLVIRSIPNDVVIGIDGFNIFAITGVSFRIQQDAPATALGLFYTTKLPAFEKDLHHGFVIRLSFCNITGYCPGMGKESWCKSFSIF